MNFYVKWTTSPTGCVKINVRPFFNFLFGDFVAWEIPSEGGKRLFKTRCTWLKQRENITWNHVRHYISFSKHKFKYLHQEIPPPTHPPVGPPIHKITHLLWITIWWYKKLQNCEKGFGNPFQGLEDRKMHRSPIPCNFPFSMPISVLASKVGIPWGVGVMSHFVPK